MTEICDRPLSPVSRAHELHRGSIPGAYAPGFMLSPANAGSLNERYLLGLKDLAA
jgi:hypothetical protein